MDRRVEQTQRVRRFHKQIKSSQKTTEKRGKYSTKVNFSCLLINQNSEDKELKGHIFENGKFIKGKNIGIEKLPELQGSNQMMEYLKQSTAGILRGEDNPEHDVISLM